MRTSVEPASEQSNPPAIPTAHKELWAPSDLEIALSSSRTTVHRIRREPDFPKPVLIRGLQRWIPAEVRAWIHNRPRAA